MLTRFITIYVVTLYFVTTAAAQLCQGSLGDPIVFTSFGSGLNPGPSLPAASTTYQYVAGDCPQDGFYTVRNNTSNCFGNSWHSLTADHTGNPSGYFMLVNASVQPGAFYVDTVRGLCTNSKYEFAAWIMNVIIPSACNGNTILPDLTFTIEKTDGTVLQTYNTGAIAATASPIWKQYGSFFTTPSGIADVVLRIVNNAPGGCGNDLALDDISFRACGPALSTAIAGSTTTSAILCEGTAGNFSFSCTVSAGYTNPEYQWQQRFNNGAWSDIPGQTTTSLSRNFPASTTVGIYDFRLNVAEAGNIGSLQCSIASSPLSIFVNANPVSTAGNNGPVCEGDTLILVASGGTQYSWSGPNGFTSTGSPSTIANLQLMQAGKYYAEVKNAAGCVTKDSTIVVINPKPQATTIIANTTICAGDSVQLTAGGGLTFQWYPLTGLSDAGILNPKAAPVESTTYSAIVTNQYGCVDTAFVLVNVVQKPVANAGPDKIILQGQQVQLNGSINDSGNSFTWSPVTFIDNINSLQPFVNPPNDLEFILKVTSNFGCGISSDTVFVKVYKDIFVPNAFSPNGDGMNDTWNIPALAAYPFFEISVYNRWGQKVFNSRSMLNPWDGKLNGKPLPVGAYNYFINVGAALNQLKGTVLIIR